MATNQSKTQKNSYFCPLCNNKLNVDSTFSETRCEACGMYVINTDAEMSAYRETIEKTKYNDQQKQQIETILKLVNEEKYKEANKMMSELIAQEPDNHLFAYLYLDTTWLYYKADIDKKAKKDPKSVVLLSLNEQELNTVKNCGKVVEEANKKNPNHDLISEYVNALYYRDLLLNNSSFAYIQNTINYNVNAIAGVNFPTQDDCVKLVKEEKLKTSTTTKKEYRDYLSDPEPIPFPGASGIKWLSITFWILGVISLFSIALILGIWVDRRIIASLNLDFSKYNFRDLLVPTGLGLMIVVLWLSWIIYWIVRKFKKIDDDEPTALKWTRRGCVVALILSVVYLAWKIVAVVVCNSMGEIVDTGMVLEAEKEKLYITIAIIYALISLLIIFKTVLKQRFYDLMNGISPSFASFIRNVVLGLEFVSLATLIILGLAGIVHLINNNLVNVIFGTEAELVKQIVKIGLIASAGVFVVGLTIDIIWSNTERKKEEEIIAKNLEKIKENKAKFERNIKTIPMSAIRNKEATKKKLLEFGQERNRKYSQDTRLIAQSIEDSKKLVTPEYFGDFHFQTYDEIDREIYTLITGKKPPEKQIEPSNEETLESKTTGTKTQN